jgi:DNA modification methylase
MSQLTPIPDIAHSIVYVQADILNPAEYNPRKHTAKQIEHLKESIKRYGLVDPIIVNNNPDRMNIVIGGHFRLKVAKELGMVEVPVIYISLTLELEKELNLRLNQNTWEWDFELLKDFDMSLLLDVGFGNVELSSIWDDMLGVEEDGFDIEKELEKIIIPISKLGDIYALGNHRIMCGDSTNEEDVKKLVDSLDTWQAVTMLYYDPPYNIWLDYSKGLSNGKSYGGKKTNDARSKEDYSLFLEKALHNWLRYAEKDVHVFMWCDPNSIWLIQSLYESLGILPRRVCLWIKNNMNATPNVAFNRAYEPCVYGTKWKPHLSTEFRNLHEVLDKEVWVGNRVLEDIIDLFDIWLAKRLSVGEYEHPTEKPPTLHEKPLKRCTKAWDTVLDLFGWSWSTLIACEQLKRQAVLMEHEPIFIDLIISRYEKLTGNRARKLN